MLLYGIKSVHDCPSTLVASDTRTARVLHTGPILGEHDIHFNNNSGLYLAINQPITIGDTIIRSAESLVVKLKN